LWKGLRCGIDRRLRNKRKRGNGEKEGPEKKACASTIWSRERGHSAFSSGGKNDGQVLVVIWLRPERGTRTREGRRGEKWNADI